MFALSDPGGEVVQPEERLADARRAEHCGRGAGDETAAHHAWLEPLSDARNLRRSRLSPGSLTPRSVSSASRRGNTVTPSFEILKWMAPREVRRAAQLLHFELAVAPDARRMPAQRDRRRR